MGAETVGVESARTDLRAEFLHACEESLRSGNGGGVELLQHRSSKGILQRAASGAVERSIERSDEADVVNRLARLWQEGQNVGHSLGRRQRSEQRRRVEWKSSFGTNRVTTVERMMDHGNDVGEVSQHRRKRCFGRYSREIKNTRA